MNNPLSECVTSCGNISSHPWREGDLSEVKAPEVPGQVSNYNRQQRFSHGWMWVWGLTSVAVPCLTGACGVLGTFWKRLFPHIGSSRLAVFHIQRWPSPVVVNDSCWQQRSITGRVPGRTINGTRSVQLPHMHWARRAELSAGWCSALYHQTAVRYSDMIVMLSNYRC